MPLPERRVRAFLRVAGCRSDDTDGRGACRGIGGSLRKVVLL